jgi:hypothetical protein
MNHHVDFTGEYRYTTDQQRKTDDTNTSWILRVVIRLSGIEMTQADAANEEKERGREKKKERERERERESTVP